MLDITSGRIPDAMQQENRFVHRICATFTEMGSRRITASLFLFHAAQFILHDQGTDNQERDKDERDQPLPRRSVKPVGVHWIHSGR
ncbi:MAG: hypothetical protein R3E95_04055 [Thiolinea sp.]